MRSRAPMLRVVSDAGAERYERNRRADAWGVGSVLVFDALFSGMDGVGYSGAQFENGYGQGFDGGYNAGFDQGQSQDAGGWEHSGWDNSGGSDNSAWGEGGGRRQPTQGARGA